jgi:predicted acetyltransferase
MNTKFIDFINEELSDEVKVLTLSSNGVYNLLFNNDDFKDKTLPNRLQFATYNNFQDYTQSTVDNNYYIVLMLNELVIGLAKVSYISKKTSTIKFVSIDEKYRRNNLTRLIVDAIFKEAKKRNKQISITPYTILGKERLQHIVKEFADKYDVKFIDRKDTDSLYDEELI